VVRQSRNAVGPSIWGAPRSEDTHTWRSYSWPTPETRTRALSQHCQWIRATWLPAHVTDPNDDPSSQAHSRIAARRFFIVLLVASTVLLAVVVRPLAGALFMAAALATVLAPVHRWLSAKLKQRSHLAAGLLVAGLVVLVLGPVVALSAFVVDESIEGAKFVTETVRSEGVKGLVERLPESVRGVVTSVLSRLPEEPGELLQAAASEQGSAQGTKAAGLLGAIVAATGSIVFRAR